MADRKLEYWYDWSIEGLENERREEKPKGKKVRMNVQPLQTEEEEWQQHEQEERKTKKGSIFDLRKLQRARDQKKSINKSNDIDRLCEMIETYPDSTLMDSDVWYTVTILRQKALKDRGGRAANELRRVCKAIRGDDRGKKSQEDLGVLKTMILSDIDFFREIRDRTMKEPVTIQQAIADFLTRDATEKTWDRRLKEDSNYETVYYEYKRIYKKLAELSMTEAEIFSFFKSAAEHIDKPNAAVDVQPDNRHLTFIKTKTWYIKEDDIFQDLLESKEDQT